MYVDVGVYARVAVYGCECYWNIDSTPRRKFCYLISAICVRVAYRLLISNPEARAQFLSIFGEARGYKLKGSFVNEKWRYHKMRLKFKLRDEVVLKENRFEILLCAFFMDKYYLYWEKLKSFLKL